MPTFLLPERIKEATNRLIESRASIGFINFFILKRALVLSGKSEVVLSTKDTHFMSAIDDLAGCYPGASATLPRLTAKPFVNVFGSAEKNDKYLGPKFTTNGPADTLAGRNWGNVTQIVGSDPRHATLKPGYATQLATLLLKTGDKLPGILDTVIWFYRARDISAVTSAAKSMAENADALVAQFRVDLGPPGHPERPADPPDYVREYERRRQQEEPK